MEFGKRHDTTDTTDFYPCQLVTDLLRTCRLCCGLVTHLLWTCYGETGVMDFGLNSTDAGDHFISLHSDRPLMKWRFLAVPVRTLEGPAERSRRSTQRRNLIRLWFIGHCVNWRTVKMEVKLFCRPFRLRAMSRSCYRQYVRLYNVVCPSLCLSVCLSVTMCIVVLRVNVWRSQVPSEP